MSKEQSCRLASRFHSHVESRLRLWASHPLIATLTLATAGVWFLFGIWFKVLGMVPRHRSIVAAILGEAAAGPAVVLIGAAETAIAFWILSGIYPRLCAVVQSIVIATMNTLELSFAHDLLLAPTLMVAANVLFLIIVWLCAFKIPTTRSVT